MMKNICYTLQGKDSIWVCIGQYSNKRTAETEARERRKRFPGLQYRVKLFKNDCDCNTCKPLTKSFALL